MNSNLTENSTFRQFYFTGGLPSVFTIAQLQEIFVKNLGSLLVMYDANEGREAITEATQRVTSILLDYPSERGKKGLTVEQYAKQLANNYKDKVPKKNWAHFIDGISILCRKFDEEREMSLNHNSKLFRHKKNNSNSKQSTQEPTALIKTS